MQLLVNLKPIEKGIIWLNNMRDYICRIFGIQSYFDNLFFESNNSYYFNKFCKTYFDTFNQNNIKLTHLSIILNQFIQNFISLTHPKYYKKYLIQ